MHAKIDIDIAENILKAYARRNRNQLRVYGILLGNIEGKGVYHIKNCIYGYIYESNENESGDQQSTVEVHYDILKIIFKKLFSSKDCMIALLQVYFLHIPQTSLVK